jgi:parvulin-like peptidyl-prolyl isomerase
VEQQVAADVTAQQPTEAELKAYFEKYRPRYASDGTMTLHELVLAGPADAAAMAKAAQAVKALRAGTPVEAVMAQSGMKESGRVSDGEEFYFAAKIHLGDKLFEIAKTLKNGAVSDPVAQGDGVHVLAMIKNNMPVLQDYADAREKVFFDYKKDEQDRLEKADFNYLKNKADIRITPEYRQEMTTYK